MEVVGLSAGLISLALQVADGTKKLRDAYKVAGTLPTRIDGLTRELDYLRHVAGLLDRWKEQRCQDALIAAHCRSSMGDVAAELDRLAGKVNRLESSKGLKVSARKLSLARSCPGDLDRLEKLVQVAKANLILGMGSLRVLHDIQAQSTALNDTSIVEIGHDEDERTMIQSPSPATIQSRAGQRPLRNADRCALGRCPCRCHTQGSVYRHLWTFKYTPLSMILGDCNNPRCDGRKYNASFRVTLFQFGLNWAITAAIGMQSGRGGYSIHFSLRPQHIVPFDSEGFELLRDFRSLNLDEGISNFRTLYHREPAMIHHVNPDGDGYIKALLKNCGCGWTRCSDVQALLQLFVQEFHMTQGFDDISLLNLSVGRGMEYSYVTDFLNLGFDPSVLESPRAEGWPQPMTLSWCGEDIFYIGLIGRLLNVDPEFGGSSSLQYDILCHPARAIETCRRPLYRLDLTANFLGQTPLHLAVPNTDVLLALLDAGHPVDVRDKFGITPLTYAAGLGHLDSAKALLSAGVDPLLEKSEKSLLSAEEDPLIEDSDTDFVSVAICARQYELLSGIMQHLKTTEEGRNITQAYGRRILTQMATNRVGFDIPEPHLEVLVSAIGDINFKFDVGGFPHQISGNHLLHYEWRVEQIEVFMKHGFKDLNHKNSIGETALMCAVQDRFPGAAQYYIAMGANVDDQDIHGTCILAHSIYGNMRSQSFDYWYRCVQGTARALLNAGADTEINDDCDCHCSASGCTITHGFPASFERAPHKVFYDSFQSTMEWLYLLEDCGREDVMRSALNSLIRIAHFGALGMTHTCCGLSGVVHEGRSRRPENERVAIQTRERDKSKELETEMESIGDQLSLAELLARWQTLIFQSHLSYRDRKGLPPWKDGLEMWYVSTNEGCFGEEELVSLFTRSLRHLVELEIVYEERGSARRASTDWDAWYNRRLSWVLQLLDIFEVSPLYLRVGMQSCLEKECRHWEEGVRRGRKPNYRRGEKRAAAMMKHFWEARAEVLASKA